MRQIKRINKKTAKKKVSSTKKGARKGAKKKKLTFKRFKRIFFPLNAIQNIFLVPAISLILLGLMLFVFPELLKYAIAVLFVYTGVVLAYISVIAVNIKRNTDRMVKKFKGGLVVQGSPLVLSEDEFQEVLSEGFKSKKTIYH